MSTLVAEVMPNLVSPRRWAVWSLPPGAVAFLVALHASTAVLVAGIALSQPIAMSVTEWSFFALCVAAPMLGVLQELTVGQALGPEDRATGQGVYVTTETWPLAATLILPLPWGPLTAVPAALFRPALHFWAVRAAPRMAPERPIALYKGLFGASQYVLGLLAAGVVFRVVVDHAPLQDGALILAAGASAVLVHEVAAIVPLAVVLRLVADTAMRATARVAFVWSSVVVLSMSVPIAVVWEQEPLLVVTFVPLSAALQKALVHSQLLVSSRVDAKTGIANAQFWRTTASAHVARARDGGSSCAVLMVDLDHFKRVNDEHGHLAGDRVLAEVAKRLRGAVRPTDVVGRFGGEEFAVLLCDAPASLAVALAERCREAVRARPIDVDDETALTVSCSIGVSSSEALQSATLLSLVESADRALYEAKASGRDRVVKADPEAQVVGAGR